MAYSVSEIEGIGPAIGKTLKAAGIDTTDELLERCSSKKGRGAVARETGLSESQLLKWTNHADLMRIKGVGGEYAELLEASGVDTVKELGTRNAANLAAKMAEVNEAKSLTRRVPGEDTVADWVAAAKNMEQRVSH